MLTRRIPLTDPDADERENMADRSEPVFAHERELVAGQRHELPTLRWTTDLILDIIQRLCGMSTRDEIERTICEQLAASELYQFAWIGQRALDDDRIVPRVSAGEYTGELDAIAATVEEDAPESSPAERALSTCEVQVATPHELSPGSNCEAIQEQGFESVAAIPLCHDTTAHGVLVVYTVRPEAFESDVQTRLAILGEVIGFALGAIGTHQLLFADAVVELEFRTGDANQFLVRHSDCFDCVLSLEGYVATTSGGWLLYVAVQDVSPALLCDAADDVAGLERARVVQESPDSGLIEYRFDNCSLLEALAASGGKLRSAEVAAGSGRLVVETPQSFDIRELCRRIHGVYPEVEMVAKHERDRSVAEVSGPSDPFGRLTDRQREALETAYHAGYFHWPRESTAEEVAEAMGIAAPTFHRHIRRAEKQLLGTFFDREGCPTD